MITRLLPSSHSFQKCLVFLLALFDQLIDHLVRVLHFFHLVHSVQPLSHFGIRIQIFIKLDEEFELIQIARGHYVRQSVVVHRAQEIVVLLPKLEPQELEGLLHLLFG